MILTSTRRCFLTISGFFLYSLQFCFADKVPVYVPTNFYTAPSATTTTKTTTRATTTTSSRHLTATHSQPSVYYIAPAAPSTRPPAPAATASPIYYLPPAPAPAPFTTRAPLPLPRGLGQSLQPPAIATSRPTSLVRPPPVTTPFPVYYHEPANLNYYAPPPPPPPKPTTTTTPRPPPPPPMPYHHHHHHPNRHPHSCKLPYKNI
jgi:hypothetical protein